MRYKTLFQKSLSTYCGFVIAESTDIHTLNDLKKVEKIKLMKTNKEQRDVLIISEIAPQHMGSMNEIKRMILQSKMSGVILLAQLYSSEKLWGDKKRLYLDTTKEELKEINTFCEDTDIELSASIFDEEKLDWCEQLNFKRYKIASRTIKDDLPLCEKIISTSKI